jgi:hypothetical protein
MGPIGGNTRFSRGPEIAKRGAAPAEIRGRDDPATKRPPVTRPDRVLRTLLMMALSLCAPRALEAQRTVPLEGFVASVARLWAEGDAGALVELAPEDGRIVLDLGDGRAGAVEARHVAAALRDLFRQRDNVSVRPTQVTLAGGQPVRGFGELAWVSRPRGVTSNEAATVYVGAVWEGGRWKIREIRLLR